RQALGTRLEEVAREREEQRRRMEGLEAERAGLEAERAALLAQSTTLTEEEGRQTGVCTGARDRVTQLRSRVESLRELEARSEGCTRGVASLLARDPEAATLLAGALRGPAGLERGLAAAPRSAP